MPLNCKYAFNSREQNQWTQSSQTESRDRNDAGDHRPIVNLVVLSLPKPMELLLGTTNNAFTNGIPVGMTPEVVAYFTTRGVRVLLAMGGVTFTDS